MKIKFLGAAGTVTGSSYVLTSGSGKSILIDLGMFQGTSDIDALNYERFEYDGSQLLGMVLTHAHLDHCGRLPILLPQGFRGNIWMTGPTRDLTALSLIDSAKIAVNDKKEILYDRDLAESAIDLFKTVNYHETFQIGDFTITMHDAGHILGSASLEIVDKQADSDIKKIVFSGDLGNYPEDLVPETEFIDSADAVVMESTYGDRLHPSDDYVETIQSEINAIEVSGGTLLIPAFALERTQELLHVIMHLKKKKLIQAKTPIFLDSPMAEKATAIYIDYPQFFNEHVQSELRAGSPFAVPGLEVIGSREESDAIHDRKGPKVIIAGSGMMTGGRILKHSAFYLPMFTTRLLIVGYQGEDTLGRELVEGSREVIIDELPVRVKAELTIIESMSSHADQRQLMQWLKHIKNVKKVVLTHGENTARSVLSKKISKELGIKDVLLPVLNQEVQF